MFGNRAVEYMTAQLTFAFARSFLRQDPNVIMIGETGIIKPLASLSAALSGRLVLTAHASDAPRAINQLFELGLKRVAARLSGIQRSVLFGSYAPIVAGCGSPTLMLVSSGRSECDRAQKEADTIDATRRIPRRTAILSFTNRCASAKVLRAALSSEIGDRPASYEPMLADGCALCAADQRSRTSSRPDNRSRMGSLLVSALERVASLSNAGFRYSCSA